MLDVLGVALASVSMTAVCEQNRRMHLIFLKNLPFFRATACHTILQHVYRVRTTGESSCWVVSNSRYSKRHGPHSDLLLCFGTHTIPYPQGVRQIGNKQLGRQQNSSRTHVDTVPGTVQAPQAVCRTPSPYVPAHTERVQHWPQLRIPNPHLLILAQCACFWGFWQSFDQKPKRINNFFKPRSKSKPKQTVKDERCVPLLRCRRHRSCGTPAGWLPQWWCVI